MPRESQVRALRTKVRRGTPLPKDALVKKIVESGARFASRDGLREKAFMHALLSSKARRGDHRLALDLARCTPDDRCGMWGCAHCNQIEIARVGDLATRRARRLRNEDLSFMTLLIEVYQPAGSVSEVVEVFDLAAAVTRKEVERCLNHFPWGKWWNGRFEIEAIPSANSLSPKKRRTLKRMGYRSDAGPALLLHLHLLVAHPGATWGQILFSLGSLGKGIKGKLDVHPMRSTKRTVENVRACISYPRKIEFDEVMRPSSSSKTQRPPRRWFNLLCTVIQVMNDLGGLSNAMTISHGI